MSTDLEYEHVLDEMLEAEAQRVQALGLHYLARNRYSVRRFATAEEANDCEAGYGHHPAPMPADASEAFRRGWYDREQWVLA